MSTADVPTVLPAPLKDRVINILTRPKTEWPVIEAEATTTTRLYREYIAILAAIPAIGTFIGGSLVGYTLPVIGTFRVPVMNGLANAIVGYVLTLVGVFVAAFVIDKLAPSFESRSDQLQALKLVAYASTPAWLAGVLTILPPLAVLGLLLGLYAIYLFYLGLPVLMQTPAARVIPYMVVAALVVIVLNFLVAMLSSSITGAGLPRTSF
jgi:hypothetical protein